MYGHSTSRIRSLTFGRSLPVNVRSGRNGSFAAPAWKRATMPKCEYSSSSSGVRPALLDRTPERVERPGARVARPGEDQLPGAAGGDHLVVDEIRRQPAERQVALPLADDLVPGGEPDEVGEALDDDGRAVVDMALDRLAHRDELRHEVQAV